MHTTMIRRFSSLTLAALLLTPALPASAADAWARPDMQLDLEAALRAQESTFGAAVETGPEATGAETASREIALSEVRAEAWALDEGAEDPAGKVKPETRSLGRWLKKHWYVPLLAAVALGVALDSDDNDASGEDD